MHPLLNILQFANFEIAVYNKPVIHKKNISEITVSPIMILLLVLLSLAGSLARPQDVEFVTSLETAQDETITDNPIVGLEMGASKGNKHTNTN